MSKDPTAPFFPAPTSPVGGTGRSGRRPLLIALGLGGIGCLGLVVVVVVLGAMAFIHAAGNCPPKDFPAYPNAQSTGFNYNANGSSSHCTAGWEADATSEQVTSFYTNGLSSGPWEYVNKDDQTGDWYFQRRGDPSTIGRLQFLGHGTQTRIDLEILTGQSPSPSPSPS